ncbi:hypothetical protein ACQKO5_02105, partial [Novosphingobium subterraneum]|uniref:hypothetical protein n=1 Tax=Novosphingobium subterraneum TaxID=48936 RepID=UPI003D06E7AC
SRFVFASEPYQKTDGGYPIRETFLHHPTGHDPTSTRSAGALQDLNLKNWVKNGGKSGGCGFGRYPILSQKIS